MSSITARLHALDVDASLVPAVRRAVMVNMRQHETGSARDIYRDDEGAVVARYRFAGGHRDIVVL